MMAIPTFVQDSDLWLKKPKRKEEWMAEIEEIIEEGESCVEFICDKILLSKKTVANYLREMTQDGILEKSRRIKIAGQLTSMYVIATERPQQKTLIDEPPTRDWLVAAFFGDYKP